MSAHNTAVEFYEAPLSQVPVTEAGNIAFDRMGCVIPADTTDGAMTLVLLAPTKAGIIGTVVLAVESGDLTLTVTNGYNADDLTSITFDDAKDFVTFISIYSGTTYYWRVLAQEGTNASVEDFAVDTLTVDVLATIASANIATANIPIQTSTTLAAEHGAGAISTAVGPITTRRTVNGTIITEIKVDLTGLGCKGGTLGDAIGLPGGLDSQLGRYVVATCGIVYKLELTCLEVPAGSGSATTDINLSTNSALKEYDEPAAEADIFDTGAMTAGTTQQDLVPALTADDYFYFTEGDTAATDGVYTAGMFILRLYGHPILT